ncbi:MAG TPA: hypothetical protein PK992_08135, partial [Planctomycetaceae bacterium]|nr:hypothetical protein [Planctomycetaceae bacterium]
NDNIFLTMVVGDDENLTPRCHLIPGKSETVGDQRSIRLQCCSCLFIPPTNPAHHQNATDSSFTEGCMRSCVPDV